MKHLFSRSLAAAPGRLHMAAHSHHLWPDASFDGQVECWHDAARLADGKWDKVMGEVWPEAQGHVAAELGSGMAEAVVFAPNTHELLVRLFAAVPREAARPLHVLTSDGEFHSARRQLARWEESGEIVVERIAAEPFDSFSDRFMAAAEAGAHGLILVSQVLFGSGRRFDHVVPLSRLGRPGGPWVVIDGYHAFMAIESPLGKSPARSAFYLAGGYKYAMAGEGCAFLNAPAGFGQRPPVTGWFAEFDDLTLPPDMVGYARDAMRFMGATFDPSGIYRFNFVRRMLADNGLSTAAISAHVERLQRQLVERLEGTALGQAEPLNDPGDARFLALRSPAAQRWSAELKARDCVTDSRSDVLRIGLGIYHDEADIDRFAELAGGLS